MPHIRDILNEIKWTKKLEKTRIWYIHRGAPDDTMVLSGSDILHIGRSFLETATASIPYHRIFKIMDEEEIIFDRKKK